MDQRRGCVVELKRRGGGGREHNPKHSSEHNPRGWVDGTEENAIQSVSSRRKFAHHHQQQHFWDHLPYELVDDNEWSAIQNVFDAVLQPTQQMIPTSIGSSAPSAAAIPTRTTIPSMVPSTLPSSPPSAAAAAHERFYHDPSCPGHSPRSLKHGESPCQTASESQSVRTPERLKQRDKNFGTGISDSFSNGPVASPWKVGTRPIPCQLRTRENCLGLGSTTRIRCGDRCPEFHSNDGTSVEERAKCDSRPLDSQEHNFLASEMVVGPWTSRDEPFRRSSETVPPNAEGGNRESYEKLTVRRLPAWIGPAGRFLLSLEKSRSVEQSRDVSGPEVVINLETVEQEHIRRPNAEQLVDVASAPRQTESDRPAGVQLEQPLIGLPWGLQPSSCVDDVKPKFPKMQFQGQIVYSKTPSEVNAATNALWRRVHELQETTQVAVPIGFDIEWRATFEKGEIPRKVAVLQLCLDGHRCDVIQIIYSGIPASLQDLLETPSTLKVGVGIFGDASKLHREYQISTRKIADLSTIANKKMKNVKQWSLSSLALELTGKQVDKIRSIRCGNWEALPLSEPQLQYAATDAYAALHLYQVLASFPNPESDQS